MVVEKEVKICDSCKERKALSVCEICQNDLCSECSRTFEIKFRSIGLEEDDDDSDARLIRATTFAISSPSIRRRRQQQQVAGKSLFTMKWLGCKNCQSYLKKKKNWDEMQKILANTIIPQLKKERLADAL